MTVAFETASFLKKKGSRMMNKVKAFIERGNDGTYGVYVDLEDETLNYGIIGNGNTVEEAIEDFNAGYLEMKELFEEENKPFVEADFEFYYDTASFLSSYSHILSLAGLSRLTGLNQPNYKASIRHPISFPANAIPNKETCGSLKNRS
jgi:predicted RNase H-like HicB family nuclease